MWSVYIRANVYMYTHMLITKDGAINTNTCSAQNAKFPRNYDF